MFTASFLQALEDLQLSERSAEARAKKLLRRQGVKPRPKYTGGSPRSATTEPQDVLPKAPGLVARAARHKKVGIESPLLMRLRQKKNALQPRAEAITTKEPQMTAQALLNEETGELEVSEDVFTLLDGMVAVLESAGYEIEPGMEAEEFVDHVAEVLEGEDEDLDEAKRKALGESHKTVATVIKAAHLKKEDDDGEDDGDDDADDKKDDDKKDAKKAKGDDDKKEMPAFLKKKAKPDADDKGDADAEEAVEAEEAEESDENAEETDEDTEGEQKEATIATHVLKHAAQKGYTPGWSTHKPKKGTHYTVNHAKLKKG